VLALRLGTPVSKQQLIDYVWGGRPPKTASQGVYTYISGLRRALEPDRQRRQTSQFFIVDSAGYALNLDPSTVDTACFERHLAIARQLREDGNPREALHELDAALDLWTGAPLLGVPGPFADRERSRLDEQHFNAIEQHADLLLELGQPRDAVGTLTGFVQEHPLRESARELLMIALYRSGRQG